MDLVRTAELKPGETVSRAIYSRLGQRLLAPGVRLTEQMLTALQARRGGVYIEEEGETEAEELASASDIRARYQHLIERLRAEDAQEAADALVRRKTRIRRDAEHVVAARLPRWDGAPRRVAAAPDRVPINDAGVMGFPQGEELRAMRSEWIRSIDAMMRRLVEGRLADAAPANDLVSDLIDHVSRHAPMYPHLICEERHAEHPLAAHALATAALSVAMAARLQWSRAEVVAAGLAGLFADCGMALLDDDVQRSDRPLDDVARNRMRRHTAWSVALLEEVGGVGDVGGSWSVAEGEAIWGLPLAARIAVYQHHEREDGSGYPRGLRGASIHDVAKVVAVADTYAAAVSARPYRSRLTRFAVMRSLVEEARAGRLWRRAVGALVQTVGLFPVGSFVRLSDGRVAEVAAAGGQARAARPVIRIWRPDGAGMVAPAEVVDLRARDLSHIRIAGDVESRGLTPALAA